MDTIEQDSRRLRWLLKQIDEGQLCIAQIPLKEGAPLALWDKASTSQEVLELIDRSLASADALADWVAGNKPLW